MKNKKLREQVKSYIIVTLACVLYALSFDVLCTEWLYGRRLYGYFADH